jgi:putative hydrolase of the HAD superfamily
MSTTAILFDLDNTLYDHYYSMRRAMGVVLSTWPNAFGTGSADNLCSAYGRALDRSYERYIHGTCTRENAEVETVDSFFSSFETPPHERPDWRTFRATYEGAYMSDRRASPGVVDMLVRLRERGYATAILTNGDAVTQEEKCRAIGIRHLCGPLLTSKEFGMPKPAAAFFHYGASQLGATKSETLMVGDNVEIDVRGALLAGLRACLYAPKGETGIRRVDTTDVQTVRHWDEFTRLLGIVSERSFSVQLRHSVLEISGFGGYFITEPKHCLSLTREIIEQLAHLLGMFMIAQCRGDTRSGLSHLAECIRTIARAAALIDDRKIVIRLPRTGIDYGESYAGLQLRTEMRPHSATFEWAGQIPITAEAEMMTSCTTQAITGLQDGLNLLARDCPRAAMKKIRTSVLELSAADQSICAGDVDIHGEGLEQP